MGCMGRWGEGRQEGSGGGELALPDFKGLPHSSRTSGLMRSLAPFSLTPASLLVSSSSRVDWHAAVTP